MINNGQCFIHIPVELTFSTLNESAASRINTLHTILGRMAVAPGDANPYYLRLTEVAIASAIDRGGDMAAIGPIDHIEHIPLTMIDLILGVDGDVEGLPVWFELSSDPATIDCPFSTTTPAEKWSVWGTFGESHKPVQIGTKWYRSSAVGQSGSLMVASWWASLSRSNAISLSQFQAIQEAQQQP